MNNLFPGIPLIESPLFSAEAADLGFTPEERRIASDLQERGFAVIDFPDAELDARIARIKTNLGSLFKVDLTDANSDKTVGERRIQDAWSIDPDVRAIASNAAIISLLGKLYGRRAFPFQTLNFPVGTQQSMHSDSIHFSSLPERFMCGVWLAMEDISTDAGPLHYYPGSHRWPVVTNGLIGRRGYGSDLVSAQDPFGPAWQALCAAHGAHEEAFLARKGQALIWCANLLHGGGSQNDPTLTRWSQVTHYFFEDCIYYTPAFSDELIGQFAMRDIISISDGRRVPNTYLGQTIENPTSPTRRTSGLLARLGICKDLAFGRPFARRRFFRRFAPMITGKGVQSASR